MFTRKPTCFEIDRRLFLKRYFFRDESIKTTDHIGFVDSVCTVKPSEFSNTRPDVDPKIVCILKIKTGYKRMQTHVNMRFQIQIQVQRQFKIIRFFFWLISNICIFVTRWPRYHELKLKSCTIAAFSLAIHDACRYPNNNHNSTIVNVNNYYQLGNIFLRYLAFILNQPHTRALWNKHFLYCALKNYND